MTKACNEVCGVIAVCQLLTYFSHEVLLHVVFGDEDAAFEAAALELQVLPLTAEQVGFFLSLKVLDVLLLLGQPFLLLLLWGGLVLVQLLRTKKRGM